MDQDCICDLGVQYIYIYIYIYYTYDTSFYGIQYAATRNCHASTTRVFN